MAQAISTARMPAQRADRLIRLAGWLMCAAALLLFGALVLPLARPFPYADDWIYVGVLAAGPAELLRWVFVPNNDHFIPLMKAVQLLLLRAGGFDFRPLMALNAALALMATLCFLAVARKWRGSGRLGDLIIPMILLNPFFSAFGWGFSAQFVLSVAFSAAFLLAMTVAVERGSRLHALLAFAALAACAASGMNGLLVAVVAALAVLLATLAAPPSPLSRFCFWSSLALVLASLAPLLLWHPSTASVSPLSAPPARIADWFYQITKATFGYDAFSGGWWRFCLLAALIGAAAILTAWRIVTDTHATTLSIADGALYGAFLGHLAVVSAIVLGRAGNAEWSPGMEGHYGYLAAPVVILAWIIVSRNTGKALAASIGLVLLCLFAVAFVSGSLWRLDNARSSYPRTAEIMRAFRSPMPSIELASTHALDFFSVSDPEIDRQLAYGIDMLRSSRSRLYRN